MVGAQAAQGDGERGLHGVECGVGEGLHTQVGGGGCRREGTNWPPGLQCFVGPSRRQVENLLGLLDSEPREAPTIHWTRHQIAIIAVIDTMSALPVAPATQAGRLHTRVLLPCRRRPLRVAASAQKKAELQSLFLSRVQKAGWTAPKEQVRRRRRRRSRRSVRSQLLLLGCCYYTR